MKNETNDFRLVAGVKVPKLIYGTAWKEEKTSQYVQLALRSGFRGIDTACQPKHYQEELVGKAIQETIQTTALQRTDIFLQSKFTPFAGHDPKRIPYDPSLPLVMQIENSFQKSLENLRTTFLDSLVLHSPLESLSVTLEAWSVFEKLTNRGLVKLIGISNCYDFEFFVSLFKASKVKPSILQNRFYKDSNYDKNLRKFCLENGILYQSFWSLTANPHILKHSFLEDLAKKYNRSVAQIWFNFLTLQGISVLVGTRSEEHMLQDLSIFDMNLTENETETIKHLL